MQGSRTDYGTACGAVCRGNLIVAINIDGIQELAEKHGIQGIPTLVIYKDNQEVQRFISLQRESSLIESLDKVIGD